MSKIQAEQDDDDDGWMKFGGWRALDASKISALPAVLSLLPINSFIAALKHHGRHVVSNKLSGDRPRSEHAQEMHSGQHHDCRH
jgi:hypothetical protein